MIGQRQTDTIAALGVFALGAVVWRSGAAVPPSFLDTGFGSGFLPMILGGSLCVLSLLWLAEAMRSKITTSLQLDLKEVIRPIALAGLFAVFLANMSLRLVSFYPAAALFVFLACLLLGGLSLRSALFSAAVAASSTLLVWAVFTRAFLVIIR